MESGTPSTKAKDYIRERKLIKLAKKILAEHDQLNSYSAVYSKILKLKPNVQLRILAELDGTDDLKVILKLKKS